MQQSLLSLALLLSSPPEFRHVETGWEGSVPRGKAQGMLSKASPGKLSLLQVSGRMLLGFQSLLLISKRDIHMVGRFPPRKDTTMHAQKGQAGGSSSRVRERRRLWEAVQAAGGMGMYDIYMPSSSPCPQTPKIKEGGEGGASQLRFCSPASQ